MSVRIAVLDTGVTEEYKKYLNAAVAVDGENMVVRQEKLPSTTFVHGTYCLAIIRKYMGRAELSSVRILDEMGRGTVDKLVPALDWCLGQGIDIVNLSFGTTNFRDREYLLELMERYTARGLVIIAASANSGYTTYPASFPSVIGVSCTGEWNWKGDFAHVCLKSENIHTGVDILAPSVHQVEIAGSMRVTSQSNSYAAPFVTAWAGRIMEDNPGIRGEGLLNEMRAQLPAGLPPSMELEEEEVPMVLLSATEAGAAADILDRLCGLFQENDYHAYGILINEKQIICGGERHKIQIAGNTNLDGKVSKFIKNEIYYKKVDILIAVMDRQNSVIMKKWSDFADILLDCDRGNEIDGWSIRSLYEKILGQLLKQENQERSVSRREGMDE